MNEKKRKKKTSTTRTTNTQTRKDKEGLVELFKMQEIEQTDKRKYSFLELF